MKCELCNDHDAETAITLKQGGEERELYVCRECARQEQVRRQKNSHRTRKGTKLQPGLSISVTRVNGGEDEPPPLLIEALMNAVHGMVNDIERAEKERSERKEPKYIDFPCSRIESPYKVGDRMHLEGLHLIGEMPAVHRAVRALGMKLEGVDADGISETGHVYVLKYNGPVTSAKRIVKDIIDQERNARVRLFEEMPRVFGDSLCRALSILKNCRLLSSGELFDLLSPLRLAALEDMLDGIGLDEINEYMNDADLSSSSNTLSIEERDAADAARADEMNGRFVDVVLNERAEERFL
jgi:hypothetical protein